MVAPGLGKPFNVSDLMEDLILDQEYGLCPQIKPPQTDQRYPSLAFWLGRRRKFHELLGEELRLLYVALTRAQDTLILSATVGQNRFEKIWKGDEPLTARRLASAKSYADWLGFWFAKNENEASPPHGQGSLFRFFKHDSQEAMRLSPITKKESPVTEPAFRQDPQAWAEVRQRLSWNYPFSAATHRPAKTSVSMVRRGIDQREDDSTHFTTGQPARFWKRKSRAQPGEAADEGIAHHSFLQFLALDKAADERHLRAEANRMVEAGLLTTEQAAALDFPGLQGFWNSDVGGEVLAQRAHICRELPFTARFSEQELAVITGEPIEPGLQNEFVVVQGVADLVVLLPGEMWLVDFKTDELRPNELAERTRIYRPQLQIYGAALEKIYRRPVVRSWIYFLSLRTSVALTEPANESAASTAAHTLD
jgi:ATP-dependent helicase/nuclease subunit A